MPGFMGNKRIIDINGSGGAFVPVLATRTCRRVEVRESPVTSAGAANTLQQSLQYKLPNDAFTQVFGSVPGMYEIAPGVAAFVIADEVANQHNQGGAVGAGAQPLIGLGENAVPAITLFQVRSGTATGTSVEVTEFA